MDVRSGSDPKKRHGATLKLLVWLLLVMLGSVEAVRAADTAVARAQREGWPTLTGRIRKAVGQPAEFLAKDGERFRLAGLRKVVFPLPTEVPESIGLPFVVQLGAGECLLGEAPRIGAKSVELDSELGSHRLPRERLRTVRCSGPGAPVLRERFVSLSDQWQLAGLPQLSVRRHRSSPTSLLLERAGQLIARTLAVPQEEGLISLWYYDDGGVHPGSSWQLALSFAGEKQPGITVTPGWEHRFCRAKLDERWKIGSSAVARQTGWHELTVSFGPSRLIIAIDGAAVVSSLRKGPGQPLTRIALQLVKRNDEAGAAQVWVDDLVLYRTADTPGELVRDPAQAVIVGHGGDCWLGDVTSTDGQQVQLRLAGTREYSLPWQDVRVLRMPQQASKELLWTGEIGDVLLRKGSRLTVALEVADDKQWQVRHPLLGPLTLRVEEICSWQPRVTGRRQEILSTCVHLGSRYVESFSRPMPDGTTLEAEVNLADREQETSLCLWVLGMEGAGPGAPFASRLRDGYLRSELWLNGKCVDYLNRYLSQRPEEPVEMRVRLPDDSLVVGKNILEIRQTVDPQSGYFDEAEISYLTVEQQSQLLTREMP